MTAGGQLGVSTLAPDCISCQRDELCLLKKVRLRNPSAFLSKRKISSYPRAAVIPLNGLSFQNALAGRFWNADAQYRCALFRE